MKQTTFIEYAHASLRCYNLQEELVPFYNDVILVEGKKDAAALESLGFYRVYTLHIPNCSLAERIEQIITLVEKRPVHILTDLDRQGEKMYVAIKPRLQQAGVHLTTKLRARLLIYGISHIEGLHQALQEKN